jgi:hypothetical protein
MSQVLLYSVFSKNLFTDRTQKGYFNNTVPLKFYYPFKGARKITVYFLKYKSLTPRY